MNASFLGVRKWVVSPENVGSFSKIHLSVTSQTLCELVFDEAETASKKLNTYF